MLDPWTFNALLQGQCEESNLSRWFNSIRQNWKILLRVPLFKMLLMATRATRFYVDIIIDSIVLYNIIIAIGGFGIILENLTSFQSTVSPLPNLEYLINVLHKLLIF